MILKKVLLTLGISTALIASNMTMAQDPNQTNPAPLQCISKNFSGENGHYSFSGKGGAFVTLVINVEPNVPLPSGKLRYQLSCRGPGGPNMDWNRRLTVIHDTGFNGAGLLMLENFHQTYQPIILANGSELITRAYESEDVGVGQTSGQMVFKVLGPAPITNSRPPHYSYPYHNEYQKITLDITFDIPQGISFKTINSNDESLDMLFNIYTYHISIGEGMGDLVGQTNYRVVIGNGEGSIAPPPSCETTDGIFTYTAPETIDFNSINAREALQKGVQYIRNASMVLRKSDPDNKCPIDVTPILTLKSDNLIDDTTINLNNGLQLRIRDEDEKNYVQFGKEMKDKLIPGNQQIVTVTHPFSAIVEHIAGETIKTGPFEHVIIYEIEFR